MPNKNIEIVARLETVPSQGIRALVDTVYLYNPEAINQLVDQLNEVIKKVDVGNYNSLEDKPVLRTYTSDSLSPDSGEVIQGIVDLHKISKTGSYNDLNDKPNLGNIAYKDSITNADIADDAGIERNKLSVGVQESLDKADKSVGDIAAEAQTRENEDIKLKSQIDSNADAIQKTREDYASADAELLSKIEDNASEISTLKTDLDDLGDQVSTIEEKIPGSASSTNQLATFSDLDNLEQDIRDDMNEKDSELEAIITAHADELTTLRGNQADLGDQVSVIESKIPESTTETNHLVTKQMLLDEEMDIREDLNETSSELQTQITAQATEINNIKEAIAGINEFTYSVVDALPEVGEKGVIYLVSKDGERPDVHDEYLWIDGQFELIGSTQVDLSGYVKDTDFATYDKAGVLKGSINNAFHVSSLDGQPGCTSIGSYSSYKLKGQNCFIAKGTLDAIRNNYVKDGLVDTTISLTATEKQTVRERIGAGEPVQLATMPTKVALDTVVQYVGETDSKYTNGYFYKYVSLGEGYTTNAASNILTFDCDQFWADVEAAGYTAESFGLDEKGKVGGWFRITGVMRSETVMTLQQINGVTVDFTTTAMTFLSGSIGMRLTFSYYLDTIYDWQRIDVQPAPDALPDQTDNAGKFLTTDGTKASWQEPAVYTRITIKRYN